ncbi:MAG: phosphatase PAP2 family protein [Cytophagales bacterium]|nr:MAG: phosphatase PAP2 family protein [Cytophagales bacterium]
MKFFKDIYRGNSTFFKLLFFYFLSGLIIVIFVRKGDDVFWLNQFHQPAADFLFRYITHLGDGLFFVLLSIIFLLFRRYKQAALIFSSFALSGLLSQLFKKVFFPDVLRPVAYLADSAMLHLVEGVEIHTNNSFPSGHTATAFAVFLMLALLFKRAVLGGFFFFLAFLVGMSRIYLVQHFFIDTYAGAWLGVLSAVAVYYWADKWEKGRKVL